MALLYIYTGLVDSGWLSKWGTTGCKTSLMYWSPVRLHSSIWAQLSYHLWWSSVEQWRHRKLHHWIWRHLNLHHRKWSCAHARPDMTSLKVRNWKGKGNNFPVFLLVFPAFFHGTPLDSTYEQWNCESSLYRVTIDLLPPMLNHVSLLICAISRD